MIPARPSKHGDGRTFNENEGGDEKSFLLSSPHLFPSLMYNNFFFLAKLDHLRVVCEL